MCAKLIDFSDGKWENLISLILGVRFPDRYHVTGYVSEMTIFVGDEAKLGTDK